MLNRKYLCQTAACCTYHRPTYFSWLLNRSHTKKILSLHEKYRKRQSKKDKTERVIVLGRRTRQKILKWKQMTALRFQTGGDIRHPWPPLRGHHKESWSQNNSSYWKHCLLTSHGKITPLVCVVVARHPRWIAGVKHCCLCTTVKSPGQKKPTCVP